MTLISPTAPEITREWQEVNCTLRACIHTEWKLLLTLTAAEVWWRIRRKTENVAALTQNVARKMERVMTKDKRMNKNDPSLGHNQCPSSKKEERGGTEDCLKLTKR